jgi:hypothetical protein
MARIYLPPGHSLKNSSVEYGQRDASQDVLPLASPASIAMQSRLGLSGIRGNHSLGMWSPALLVKLKLMGTSRFQA